MDKTSTRSLNFKRNLIFGFLNKCCLMLFPFAVRTVLIKELGSEYLGINSLFSSILQVLSITELGFSNAIVYSLYKPVAEKDIKAINSYMSFYRRIYKMLGVIITICGLILLPFLKFLIKGDVPNDINIYILFSVYLFNTSLGYYAFGYRNALINAYQRNDIISNIATVSQSLMYVVQITVIVLKKDFFCYLIVMPAFTLLNNILTLYYSNKMFPQLNNQGTLSQEEKNKIRNQVVGLLIHRLCLVSRNSLDSIFISSFLGLHMTAMYSNYYYIMNSIVGILSVVGNGMLAGIGNSIVTESVEKNYLDMKRINLIYMIMSGWCTCCLLCLYQPFMNIWVGKEMMFDFPMVILLCVYFYILKMGDVRGTYSDAAGLWWENKYRAIIETIANLILNALLGFFWGVYGIILATLISLFAINFIFGSQIIFKFYFRDVNITEYFINHAMYAAVTAIVTATVYYTVSHINIEGIFGLIIKAFSCGSVSIIMYILIYFKYPDFRNSVSWLFKKIFCNVSL